MMNDYITIAKAFSDPARVRALCALRGGELCVCWLIELLGLAPSTVSKHLSILRQAGLVESRKAGHWVFYRLPGRSGDRLAKRMTRETFRALAGDPQIEKDAQRLQKICPCDTEEPCRNMPRKK